MERTFTARFNNGSTQTVTGPALRLRIEGRYREFIVHPPLDAPGCDFFLVISEKSTGLRAAHLRRATRCERTARRWARERLKGMLEEGIGPRLHSQIETRQPDAPRTLAAEGPGGATYTNNQRPNA